CCATTRASWRPVAGKALPRQPMRRSRSVVSASLMSQGFPPVRAIMPCLGDARAKPAERLALHRTMLLASAQTGGPAGHEDSGVGFDQTQHASGGRAL